jgi:hemerythrin-like domain-containing protein
MSRRHDGLIPLTHDHHHALAAARRLRSASENDLSERARETTAFIGFFRNDTVAHFREEEEQIFPLVVDSPEAREPLELLLLQHVRMHALVTRLETELADAGPTKETMAVLGDLLKEHIRFEEGTMFPLIENLAASELESVSLEPRVRATS